DSTARALTINSSGNGVTTFGGAAGATHALASVTTNADGSTRINGGVVLTTGDQSYDDAVTLGAAATLSGADITFASTLDSFNATARALTVNSSGGGTTTFSAAVGNIHALASVTTNADGSTQINGGRLTRTGEH